VTLPDAPWLIGLNTAVSLVLFLLGLVGLLTQRRVIRQVFCLKLMLQGVCLSLIQAGGIHSALAAAQSMVVSALIVESVTMVIALALIVNIYRYYPSGDVDDLDRLRG
jgi:NADH-quinone oxidoreductase subunit K